METLNMLCEAKEIRLGFGPRHPLSNRASSFSVPSGARCALVGPNGSGKTTLLGSLLNEPKIISGTLKVVGLSQNVPQLSAHELASTIGFVAQEHVFPSDLLLVDFLQLAFLHEMGAFKRPTNEAKQSVKVMAADFGLESLLLNPMGRLSTGERQKAFLAQALLKRPKLLLLDEPTNHLDPMAREAFWEKLVLASEDNKMGILLSTHQLSYVRSHCQWVLGLRKGNIEISCGTEEFFKNNWDERLYRT